MSAFVTDTFTDAAATNLIPDHTGEVGATWTEHPVFAAGNSPIISTDQMLHTGDNTTNYVIVASGSPSSADYDVSCDLKIKTDAGSAAYGPAGRVHATLATMYLWQATVSSGPAISMQLYGAVNNTFTALGSAYVFSPAVGDTVTLKLSMSGTSIIGYVNGVSRVSVTDSSVAGPGKSGMELLGPSNDTAGVAVNSFSATGAAPAVPSKPTGFALSAVTATTCTLSYTDPLDATITSYRVEWDIDSGFPSPNSGTFVPGATTFAFSPALAYATPYFFRLIATNAGGDSTPSDTVSLTTPDRPPARNCGLSLGIGIHL